MAGCVFAPAFFVPGAAKAQAAATQAEVNVREQGAIGDGTAVDTAALQAAIDRCHAAGGGRVLVPAGTYLTGTLLIKSGVRLHLAEGATLLGSLAIGDYRNVDAFRDGVGAERGFALIAAVDATQVGLEGPGAIDGRGKALVDPLPQNERNKRPFLVRFVRCENVTVKDVHLKNSAAWTANFFQSRHVVIDGVKINSRGVSNNDGIDLDSCENVTVTRCDIDTGDDAICLKTTSDKPCRRISISGCRLKSHHGAIKFGTESCADFENIRISRCDIRDTRNGGIKLLSVDGARIRDVVITDLTMDDVATPIFIRLGARLRTFREGAARKPVGTIENVEIRNIRAKAAANAQLMPPSGIFITGIPGHPVRNLRFENISLEVAGGGTREQGRAVMQENIDVYPEINRFGPHLPAYGVYARHVQGLEMKGVLVKTAAPDLRPAIVSIDAADLVFQGWRLPAAEGAESLVRLEETQGARFAEFSVKGGPSPFLRVEGPRTERVVIEKQPELAAAVEAAAGAPASSVSLK